MVVEVVVGTASVEAIFFYKRSILYFDSLGGGNITGLNFALANPHL